MSDSTGFSGMDWKRVAIYFFVTWICCHAILDLGGKVSELFLFAVPVVQFLLFRGIRVNLLSGYLVFMVVFAGDFHLFRDTRLFPLKEDELIIYGGLVVTLIVFLVGAALMKPGKGGESIGKCGGTFSCTYSKTAVYLVMTFINSYLYLWGVGDAKGFGYSLAGLHLPSLQLLFFLQLQMPVVSGIVLFLAGFFCVYLYYSGSWMFSGSVLDITRVSAAAAVTSGLLAIGSVIAKEFRVPERGEEVMESGNGEEQEEAEILS